MTLSPTETKLMDTVAPETQAHSLFRQHKSHAPPPREPRNLGTIVTQVKMWLSTRTYAIWWYSYLCNLLIPMKSGGTHTHVPRP